MRTFALVLLVVMALASDILSLEVPDLALEICTNGCLEKHHKWRIIIESREEPPRCECFQPQISNPIDCEYLRVPDGYYTQVKQLRIAMVCSNCCAMLGMTGKLPIDLLLRPIYICRCFGTELESHPIGDQEGLTTVAGTMARVH